MALYDPFGVVPLNFDITHTHPDIHVQIQQNVISTYYLSFSDCFHDGSNADCNARPVGDHRFGKAKGLARCQAR